MIKKIGIIAGIILVFVVGILLGVYLSKNNSQIEENIQSDNYREIPIVGVDDKGRGVSGLLSVEAKPGSGLVLVNINDVLADYLTQLSARTAAKIAENHTGKNLANSDLIYNIKANASAIEGSSAGSVMAVATIAVLENKQIKEKVFMTGAIDVSGNILPVSGILEKATAAKSSGAKLFLIPSANYVQSFEKQKSCAKYNEIEYCEINFNPIEGSITNTLGIETKEVKNISEALEYFIEK